jgi:hypothetical protein
MLPILAMRESRSGSHGVNRMNTAGSFEEAFPASSVPGTDLICREILVYGIDSHVSRFAVSDPQASRHLLERVHPARVFAQRNLVLTGDTSTTIFPCAAVVRVDLIMDGYPDWSFHHHVSDMVEITEAEWQEQFHPEGMTRLRANPPKVGDPFTLLTDITLANAERIFVQCELHVPELIEAPIWTMTPLDHSLMAQHLLTEPSVYIRRRGGGAILLNSANVVRLNFHSGLVDIPNAWPANLMEGVSEPKGHLRRASTGHATSADDHKLRARHW